MTAILEALLDEAKGNEDHPAMGLIDIVGDLIEDFEAKHHPLPDPTGVQALKFLMEQHGRSKATCARSAARAWSLKYSPASANSIFDRFGRLASDLGFPLPLSCEARSRCGAISGIVRRKHSEEIERRWNEHFSQISIGR